MYCNGFGRKRSLHDQGTVPAFAWRDCGEPRGTLVKVAGVRALIPTKDPLNTLLELCRYTILLDTYFVILILVLYIPSITTSMI
jgi:hypothetical protein